MTLLQQIVSGKMLLSILILTEFVQGTHLSAKQEKFIVGFAVLILCTLTSQTGCDLYGIMTLNCIIYMWVAVRCNWLYNLERL